MKHLVILLVASSLAAADLSREELLRTPKYIQAKPSHYQSFTAAALRDALKVVSRRNYARSGSTTRPSQCTCRLRRTASTRLSSSNRPC
jgi:hypothetical protein